MDGSRKNRCANGRTELWGYSWDLSSKPPVKIDRVYLGVEQPPAVATSQYRAREAICWSYGRTLGNIAVANDEVIGAFPALSGNDAILECEIVSAGLYRNGKPRWWCRTHQHHWGTIADLADAAQARVMRCAHQTQPMSYVVEPPNIPLEQYAEVGVWCSLTAALTSRGVLRPRHPRLHVHLRNQPDGPKIVDRDFDALTLSFNPLLSLFGNQQIDRVHVTPPGRNGVRIDTRVWKANHVLQLPRLWIPTPRPRRFREETSFKALCGNCGGITLGPRLLLHPRH